jgi:hypothetical protein
MFNYIAKRLKTITPFQSFSAISVLVVLVLIVKYFGIKEDYQYLRIEVIKKPWSENYDPYGYRAPFWISDKVKVGLTEKNASGKVTAELIDVENYLRGGEEVDMYLVVKVKAVLNKRTGRYTYKDLPIDLGSAITLNLNTLTIYGQIIDNLYPQNGYPKKELMIKVRGRNIEPFTYSKVTPGLKMYNRANNMPVAEFVSVSLEEPSLDQVSIEKNKYLYIKHAPTKDLVATIKLQATQIDGRYYFSGHQNIVTNEPIWIYTDQVHIYGLTIEDVAEISTD